MQSNQNTPNEPIKRPRLVSAIEAFGVSLFGYFTIFAVLDFVWSGNLMVTMGGAGLLTILLFVCIYILCLGLRGFVENRRLMIWAAVFPSALVIVEAAWIMTVLINGENSPLGGALEGISGPLTNGLLPVLPWPVSFAIGAVLGMGLIYWLATMPNKKSG